VQRSGARRHLNRLLRFTLDLEKGAALERAIADAW
jgi:hypothetical protein